MENLEILLKTGSQQDIEQNLNAYHPSDIAGWLSVYAPDFRKEILDNLSTIFAADILNFMDHQQVGETLAEMPLKKAASLTVEMDTDEATDMLKTMDESFRRKLLDNMRAKDRDLLNRFLGYAEKSAGSIMTSDAIVLSEDMDVKDAMKTLVGNAVSTESIQRLFVTSSNGVLTGAVDLKELIQARSPKTIATLMEDYPEAVRVNATAEEAARIMRNYQIYLLPVVDEHTVLQGVITLDDAADILEEAGEEDYARFASVSAESEIRDSLFRSAFHRLPWLTLLLGLGLLVSAIISGFEDTLAQVTVLVLFQPLIFDMAGNTGTQSLAVTIRGLANGYFTTRDEAKTLIWRETRAGMLNGVAIGMLGFMTTFLFLTILGTADASLPLVGLTVALALFAALSVASLLGTLVPLVLHRFGFDPAAASGPFITTFNDVVALLIYFSIATLILVNI